MWLFIVSGFVEGESKPPLAVVLEGQSESSFQDLQLDDPSCRTSNVMVKMCYCCFSIILLKCINLRYKIFSLDILISPILKP